MPAEGFAPLARIAEAPSPAAHRSKWSESIAKRRLRTIQPRSAMALTLLERTRAVLNMSQRWSPEFHLHHAYVRREDSPKPSNVMLLTESVVFQQSLLKLAAEPQTRFVSAILKRPAAGHREPMQPTPLQQILRRVEQTDTASVLHRTLSLHGTVSLTRRLVEERRRVDLSHMETSILTKIDESQSRMPAQAPGMDMVNRASAKDAMVLRQPVSTEQPADRSSLTTAPNKSVVERHQPAMPPPLNIEQITEHVIRQIDYRLIAHRERMGRPGV